MKWVEYLQIYTSMIKHKLDKSNTMVDGLNRWIALLETMPIVVVGFEAMEILERHGKNKSNYWWEIKHLTWNIFFKEGFLLKEQTLWLMHWVDEMFF